MDSSILKVDQLVKRYGQYTALNGVSLEVPKGTIFGLLGPNGAGKTSLIRIINQITLPDSGAVYIDGEALHPKHIAQIGYMPEERGLYKSMKVGEQALYLAQLKGMPKSEAEKQLKMWFEKLEIGGWWDKKIEELSKGMAQKVQFVVTVLHKPKLLIFDEPFSGFDPVNANIIKNHILDLKKEGSSIIFSTHRMESVEELCDHIALINRSEKILEGSLQDVKRSFRTHTYQLELITDQQSEVKNWLSSQFEMRQAQFNSIDQALQLEVVLGDANANEVLRQLMHYGTVSHFSEKIPSVNDIFIQQVTQANAPVHG